MSGEETPAPLRPRFASGVAWMFMGGWAEQALNFGIFIALARLLGADAFGVIAMGAAFVVLAEGLVRETLTEPLIARKVVEPGHLDAVFWMLALLSLAITALIAAGSSLAAAFYGEPRVGPALAVLALSVTLTGLGGVPIAILRREMRFRALALRAIAGAAAGGVAGIAAALAGWGIWALVAQRLALLLVDTALVWLWAGWRPGLAARRHHARDILGFGGSVLGLTAANLAATQVPALVIGPLLGPAAMGQFAIAWRLVETASFLVTTPLRLVAQSAFARLRHAGEGGGALMAEVTGVASLVALSAFGGMALLADPLTALLFGPGWEGAGPVLAALCLSGAWLCLEKVQTAFCLAAGQAGGLARLALAEALIGTLAMAGAAPFGIAAAALAFALRSWVLSPFRFALVARLGGTGLAATARIAAPLLPAALLMAGAVLGFLHLAGKDASPLLLVAGGAGLGAATFLATAALTFPHRLAATARMLTGRG